MIGCLRTCASKQPIIALYFETENELKFLNLAAMSRGGSIYTYEKQTSNSRFRATWPSCINDLPEVSSLTCGVIKTVWHFKNTYTHSQCRGLDEACSLILELLGGTSKYSPEKSKYIIHSHVLENVTCVNYLGVHGLSNWELSH